MAETISSGAGMANVWIEAKGVLSLKTLLAEHDHLHGTAGCGPARPACEKDGQRWPSLRDFDRVMALC